MAKPNGNYKPGLETKSISFVVGKLAKIPWAQTTKQFFSSIHLSFVEYITITTQKTDTDNNIFA